MSSLKKVVIYKRHHKYILCLKCGIDISDLGNGQRIYCDRCRRIVKAASQRNKRRNYEKKITKSDIILQALSQGPKTRKQLEELCNSKNVKELLSILRNRKGFPITTRMVTTYTLRMKV